MSEPRGLEQELRFDGQVAIVTGAGRGIGRAYAQLLAARGASVVVNDVGAAVDGHGADASPATDVVAEIAAAGGRALADVNDIATETGANALVQRTIEHFGSVDILINNAGIMRWAGMPDLDAANLDAHFDVHVLGSFQPTRAVWPHFVARGGGRVVMTTSAGVFGLAANTGYAAAKGAVIGLTRSLAIAGRADGIVVNAIAPAAYTRMAGRAAPGVEHMDPALVAPLVAYLAHESCPNSGDIYAAGAGRFAKIVLAATDGYLHPGDPATVEDVAAHWDEINDIANVAEPRDLLAWSTRFMAHLDPSPER